MIERCRVSNLAIFFGCWLYAICWLNRAIDATRSDKKKADDDDWDTDPTPVNAGLSEKDLRKGSSLNKPTEDDTARPAHELGGIAKTTKEEVSKKTVENFQNNQKNLYGEKRLDENVSGQ